MAETQAQYFSRYGGFWTDREDASDVLAAKLEAAAITPDEAHLLEGFMERGFVVLEGAIPHETIDRFELEIENAFVHGDERLLIQEPGAAGGRPLVAGTSTVRQRVVDAYVHYESARELLFAEPLERFLRIIFDAPPLLFQSLSFDRGSQQGMHQDTAYVVTNSPLELAASWIALEDVREGSGELMYYVGSHRLPEYHFSGEFKHWNPERDGDEQHSEWARQLHEKAGALGLEQQTFLARKGDVLIWAADLAHGGSPSTDDALTRKSLVGHYCPTGVQPHYFSYAPDHAVEHPYRGSNYSSLHYDVCGEHAPAADAVDAERTTPERETPERDGLRARLRRALSR